MDINDRVSKTELFTWLKNSWDEINTFLDSLTEEQASQPTDEAGWTIKDHVIHMAMWENGINALLNRQTRYAAMGLDKATWDNQDVDVTNAEIQKKFVHLTWKEARDKFNEVHQNMLKTIDSLTEDDLHLPYADYDAEGSPDRPVILWIGGNTFHHYAEHRPWMEAILEG